MDRNFINYNCKDSLVTALCAVELLKELKETGLEKFYFDIVHPLSKAIIGINLRGVKVDDEARLVAISSLTSEIQQGEEDVNSICGREVNISGNSFRDYLYDEVGIPLIAGLGRSVNEDTLIKIIAKHPEMTDLCHLVLSIREKKKMVSTFLSSLTPGIDGRVHGNYRIGPVTGRLACTKPALQQIPEGVCRSVFVAEKGKVFIYSDFSQVELRIFAVLAQDRSFLETFASGTDIHDRNARELFRIPPEKTPTAVERYFAKTYIFGTLYGGSVESIKSRGASAFKAITLDTMRQCQEAFLTAHPNMRLWRLEVEKELRTKKRLVNAFGRPRIFFGNIRDTIRQAYNFPIQSAAADLMNSKLIQIDKEYPNCLILQVHDSIILEVQEREAEKVERGVKRILEEEMPELNNYSFPVKMKTGRSWGEF